MGRVGSEHDVSPKRDGEEATSRACTLSIHRVTEKDDINHAYHIVECKLDGTSVALQQRFCSLGPQDPEGRTAAFCFAISTGSLPSFKAFLFEHSDFLSSTRSGDVSYLTAGANMQSCFTVFVNPRKNASLGLCFTAAICRFRNVSMRSISFRSNDEQVGIEQVTTFLHSSKCRSWVQKVLKRDLTFASEEAGICSPEGTLPAKCKRCGESEHPVCHDQKSQQASEDYLCPTCLMMEREAIFAIRLEEQREDVEKWENFWNEASSVYAEDNCDACCCICGCEDNEDLDDLVPCVCESNQAVVHTSCAAACTAFPSPKASYSGSIPLCLICRRGPGIIQNGGLVKCKDDGMGARGSKRSMNPIHVAGVEVKRPRTSSSDGVVRVENMPVNDASPKIAEIENNLHIESKHTDHTKLGAARHGWRSVDAPAVVPFKKRRIQIAEVPRSPSPPPEPKQISPKLALLPSPRPMSVSLEPKSPSAKPESLPLALPSSNATSSLPRSTSPTSAPSSKSMTPIRRFFSPNSGSPLSKAPPTKPLSQLPKSSSSRDASPQPWSSGPKQTCASPRSPSLKPTSPLPKLSSRSPDLSPSQLPSLPLVRTSDQIARSPSSSSEQGSRSQRSGPHQEALCGVDALKVTKESDLQSSFSPSQNQPSSSQEVEDGELVVSTEKNPDDFEVASELPEVSSQEARGHYSHVVRSSVGGFYDDRSGWDLNTEMDTWDKLSDEYARTKKKMGCVSVKRNFDASTHGVKANACVKNSSETLVTEDADNDECGILWCKQVDANKEIREAGKVTAVQQSEKFGKRETRTDVSRIANSSSWNVVDEVCEKQGPQRYRSAGKLENQANLSRTKTEEWNELAEKPEGEEHVDYGDFDCRDGDDAGLRIDEGAFMPEDEVYWKVEDTMGDPYLWESKTMSDGESERKQEDLMESCVEKCSTSGRVKSSGWDQLPEGFDNAEEALKAAQQIFSRRGRGSWVSSAGGRGSMLSSQGSFAAHRFNSRRDEFRDSSSQFGEDRHINQPSHGRENFNHMRRLGSGVDDCNAARARVSGRGAAGFHGRGRFNGWVDSQQSGSTDQWAPGRHQSSSGFSSHGATNAATAAAARLESSGFVVAPDGTISRGGRPSRGPRSSFGNSRGARGIHMTGGRAPPAGSESGPNFPNRMGVGINRNVNRSATVGIDMGGRSVRQGARPGFTGSMSDRGGLAGRGIIDRYGRTSYGGRTVDPRKSESPCKMHPSDYSYMSSRTPGLRPEARVTRSRLSPPSPEPFGRSKFFPGSARSQCSSPPFAKWSHDRREAESFRERDFKRSIPHSYGSSGRTSPHVVHGSSLTDERDWQVLAGTRSSPGARGGLNSSKYSGNARDGSSELHQSRRAEEEGHTGLMSKDSDHNRNSPREVDKVRDMRGSAYKRDRSRDDDKKRDSYRLSSRSTGGHKRASSRDGDDDATPRRHRRSC
eukprot:c25266_g1_i1 orf=598-4944(+)